MNSDWLGLFVFILFIAGTHIAEAISNHDKRLNDIERKKLDQSNRE